MVIFYRKFITIILLSVSMSMLISVTSAAENNIRSGLWEVTTTSDLLALVPHIPPQQMQQITSLAKQHGLEIPQIQDGVATSKVCVTQAMADQEIPTYFYDNESGCTVNNANKTGNRYKIDLTCKYDQFKGSGTAEGSFTSSESFTGQTEFDSIVEGVPVHVHAATKGRWIGKNCTVIKPM